MSRVVVWFSCGASSAVAAYFACRKYRDCEVVYCDTSGDEHPDNLRFLADVENWIGRSFKIISSEEYTGVDDVIERTRYMSGPRGGRCTVELKKVPRFHYQRADDLHIFGYTADETQRISRFEGSNPELRLEWILRDMWITKARCFDILRVNKIEPPVMYGLGFKHSNCLGCVKATSPDYWNRIRRYFPEVFQRRVEQSRAINCRLVRLQGKRVFLDELPLDCHDGAGEDISCGPMCQGGFDFDPN